MELKVNAITEKGARIAMYWIIVILSVIVDQTTKAAAREVLEESSMELIPGVINLIHVENTGAAFSLGQGATLLFVAVAIAFVIAATLIVWRTPDLPYGLVITIGLVAGGGLGNMIDRIMGGSVTDFIATAFIDFPVFNVADICVTIGVILSIIGYWVWESRKEESLSAQEQSHV